MHAYSLSHLDDRALRGNLASVIGRERGVTAWVLAHIAEFDARRLYVPDGFPSMYAYCVRQLRLSEDAAYKRIQAARAARQYPAIFEAVADGRMHLSGVCLLAPHLTPGNAADLLTAAAHGTKAEIEALLARRFPHTETMTLMTPVPAAGHPVETHPAAGHDDARGPVGGEGLQLAPAQVECRAPNCATKMTGQLAPGQVVTRPLIPVAHDRSLLQVMIDRAMQDKLRYAQDLLGHELPAGDIAHVLEQGLDALIEKLERRKFGATKRPQAKRRPTGNPRHIPADVKRAVWKRDGGQCTFVSEEGRRCPARRRLEFDHVQEVARGGEATVSNTRLRCRPHNQYTAECSFGTGFMARKRKEARKRAAIRRQQAAAGTV